VLKVNQFGCSKAPFNSTKVAADGFDKGGAATKNGNDRGLSIKTGRTK